MNKTVAIDARETPRTWREYLAGTVEAVRVYRWIYAEFTTPEIRGWLARQFAAQFVRALCYLLDPWLLKLAVDALIARDPAALARSVAILTGLLVSGRLFQAYGDQCKENALSRLWHRIDVRSTELALGKSLGQHARYATLLSPANVEKGRSRASEMVRMLVGEGLPAFIELAMSFAGLVVISLAGGASMALLFLVYLVFMAFVNHRVLTVYTPIDAEFRELNRYRVERLEAVGRVKTNGMEAEEVRFIDAKYEAISDRSIRFWTWELRMNTLRGVIAVFTIGVMVAYAFFGTWNSWTTMGFLWPYVQWLRRVAENLWRVADVEHQLNWNMATVRAFMRAMTLPPAVMDAPDAQTLARGRPLRVEFRGVSHVYKNGGADAESHVLRDVSFTVEPGEKVALIGPSGAGKSTLMRLLLRGFDPDGGGSVLVDGHDLRRVALGSWLRVVGYIDQTPTLFDASVRNNLVYGLSPEDRARVTDDELWALMRQLRIDFGDRLVRGLDTSVGRDGVQLSGGQAQRVLIGAAVIKRPGFMLIDEATSALDSTTEKEVQAGLEQALRVDTSALVIAHRLSTVRRLCTKFVLLRPASEDGPQVEAIARSFEELYAMSPTFRRLADDQGLAVAASPVRIEAALRLSPS